MENYKFIEWLFYFLMSGVSLYVANSIKQLRESIESLNINFASEIQKLANVKETIEKHDKIIERQSDRLYALEKITFSCRHTNTNKE